MRWFPLMMILSLFMFGSALAAEGVHSKLQMSMKMDMGAEMPEAAGMGDAMSFDGDMYSTDDRMRFDMNMMGMTSTTIVDTAKNEMWVLEPFTKQAMHSDLGDYGSNFMDMEGGFMSPTGMSLGWDEYKEMMDGMEGFSYKELAAKTLLGEKCPGMAFEVDMKVMQAAMADDEMSPEAAAMMPSSMSGVAYFSEKHDMPMLMTFVMAMEGMKMDMTWKVTEINAWTPVDSMFAIPDGYTVVEAEEMMNQLEAAGNPHGA